VLIALLSNQFPRAGVQKKKSASPARGFLARLLLLLANFGKQGKPEPIVGRFSQETLAEMIGTTRSRVSFFMNKFRKLGFIEYNGKLEVHNSLLNVVLHDKPEIQTRDAGAAT
jgi:CRP/FNR family cyclic AMP-dependent transcriptional regulator